MGSIDIGVSDHNSKKTEFPLYKKTIPNPSRSSKWQRDLHGPSPNYLLSAASSEHFEKSMLVALQEAALHDSTVLEMGYQMTDCDGAFMWDGGLLNDSSVGPILRNPLEHVKDHRDLKTIFLRDLKVGKVHRGRTMSGTLCCKTVKTSAIMNVLEEDGTDDATRLVISNSMHKSTTTAKSQLLYPQGANVSVKDPYLKRFADGMVGLLIENPSDIIFNHLPTELPSLAKQDTKEELPFKERVGKVEPREQESHGKLVSYPGSSRRESLISEQSASDKNHSQCLNQFLSVEHIDFDEERKSSPSRPGGCEGLLITHETTLVVGAKETTEFYIPTDIATPKFEELTKPTVVQGDFDSPVDLQQSLNLHSVCEQESSPPRAVEDGCDKLHQCSDDQILRDRAPSKNLSPQKCEVTSKSKKCEATRLSGDSCKGQERNNVEGTNVLRNAAVEQGETDETEEPHRRLDDKATRQDIIEVTHGCKIVDTRDCSVDCAELVVDDSLEKNNPAMLSRDLSPAEDCESSHGKPIEESKNEILASLKEGDRPSLSATLIDKENDFMGSRKTLKFNEADGTIVDSHRAPAALRLLGNKHFAQQNWAKAIDLYTQATFKAIQDSVQETKENLSPNHEKNVGYSEPMKDVSLQKEEQESEVVMDYSNRAEAWLRLHQYERAWADSERALSLDPNHLKSLFRKGRALLGLGDYQQALAHFEAANARTPFDKDVLAAIKLSRIADHQNRLGLYDLTDYYLRGRFVGQVLNCADYIGPIQVKGNIGDKGRGLFLEKSVEAGDLLLVSNPLAFVQLKSQDKSKSNLNTLTKDSTTHDSNPRVNTEIEKKLVQILLERAKVSRKNCQRLLALWHGEEGLSHQSAPSMDLFISGRQVSPPTEPIETEELDDIRLRKIIAQNAIDWNMMSTPFVQEKYEETSNDNFCGLWVLPSFINHSCIPNVSLVILGKCIFVYASKDMRPGEELQCSYFNVFQPLPKRRELASRCWGFSCRCARCMLEAKFATCLERLESLHAKIQTNPSFDMKLVIRYSPFGDKTLAEDIAKELKILRTSQILGNAERSWLQASFAKLYIFSQEIIGPHENGFPLDTVLRAMETVSPSSTSTLAVGLLFRKLVERHFNGKKTTKYKAVNQRLLRICKCIYGKHRTTVLQSLVEGLPPNVTRKV